MCVVGNPSGWWGCGMCVGVKVGVGWLWGWEAVCGGRGRVLRWGWEGGRVGWG